MIPWGPSPPCPRRSVKVVSEVIEHVGLSVLVLVSCVPDPVVDRVYWSEDFPGVFSSNVVHDEVSQADIGVVHFIDATDCPGYESAIIWRVSIKVGYVSESPLIGLCRGLLGFQPYSCASAFLSPGGYGSSE